MNKATSITINTHKNNEKIKHTEGGHTIYKDLIMCNACFKRK